MKIRNSADEEHKKAQNDTKRTTWNYLVHVSRKRGYKKPKRQRISFSPRNISFCTSHGAVQGFLATSASPSKYPMLLKPRIWPLEARAAD